MAVADGGVRGDGEEGRDMLIARITYTKVILNGVRPVAHRARNSRCHQQPPETLLQPFFFAKRNTPPRGPTFGNSGVMTRLRCSYIDRNPLARSTASICAYDRRSFPE